LALETALSLQHIGRVSDALTSNTGGGWVGYTQLALYWLANVSNLPVVKKGLAAVEEVRSIMYI
jgi:diphthine-ammonia ligase